MSADLKNQYFLERPRVDRLLEKALQSHVVTVVAGEGSGKTHAVNAFLQKEKRKTVWVQISERDNIAWRFWENYTGAVARLNPEAAKVLADMGLPESDRLFDRWLSLINNEIVSRERYALVFDDFHLMTNPMILSRAERLLIAPVSKNTIVFISRTDPSLNTVNLMAKGLLSQITTDDLRFTREETAGYFRLHNVPLEEEELTRIFQETEGWVLALSLILQGIKTKKTRRHRWNMVMRPVRQMEEHIFSAMEEGLQRFLVKLSLIEHWPRDLLERLEPEGKNISALEHLSSVIRFDPYLQGFRIHHLFLDFLREKQKLLSREEIREVHLKTARWCIENNLPIAAAVNYEQAGDCGGFVRLVESLPRMMPWTMASLFLETAERLIAAHLKDPLFRGGRLGEEGGRDWDLLFLRFIVRTRLLTLLTRFKESEREFKAGIACAEAMPPSPRRSGFLSAAYTRLGMLHFFTLRFTKNYNIVHYFEQGYRYYLENPEPIQGPVSQANVNAYAIQVGFPAAPGEIDTFIDLCSAIIPYSSAVQDGYLFGADTLARAELAYYQGDLEKAEQFARQAIFQSRKKTQYEIESRAIFYLMQISVHQGDAAGSMELERQMRIIMEKDVYLNRYIIYEIVMGRFYTRLGLTEKIVPWLKKEREERESNSLIRGLDTLMKARSLFVKKDYPAALEALKREQDQGELGVFLLGFLEMSALEAVIRHRLDDREGALGALKKAYDAARPYALNMPFIELGEAMHSLAGAILRVPSADPQGAESTGIPREWLQTIRRSASAYVKKCALVTAHYTDRETPVSSDFSPHELAILRSLSQGHTSEEIAGSMRISVKMVRSAIRSLYVRLGATNRTGAVRIAAERGLLTDTETG